MEAAMRGTAVVASRAGGLVETVMDGQTGRLVPAGDVDALAQALLELLADRSQAESLGRQARELAEQRFTVAACAEHFLQLYQQMSGAPATPATVPVAQ
jgi:glycosyltransferase involved in cell wall biosynthesis